MPDLPQFDFAGIAGYFTLLLVYIGILWGVNKAIIIAKES